MPSRPITDAKPYTFGPKGTRVGLLIFVLCYVVGMGFVTLLIFRELGVQDFGPIPPRVQQALLVALYVAAGYFILLYLILGAHRFRFFDTSFRVFTWRGWQAFAWSQVRSAQLTSYKTSVELALTLGPRQIVSVPITSYRRSATLLNFVAARIPVQIVITEKQRTLIADD